MKDIISGIFAMGIVLGAVFFMAQLAENAGPAKKGLEKHIQERMLGEF